VALEPHSIPGRLLGTVGYMSPEQAQGKTQIDHRSDIFSFGCMLFEAVTKQRPFQGESNVQSLYKICYEPARPIREFDPTAPNDLQRIIRRCLAKDPEERYQSIQDIALELKELRREMEGDTQFDTTFPPSSIGAEGSATQSIHRSAQPSPLTQTLAGRTRTGEVAAARTMSSTEVILSEIRLHKRGFLSLLLGLAIVAGLIPFVWKRFVA